MLNARNSEAEWELVYGRKKARIRISGPISSRDFSSVSTFAYRGEIRALEIEALPGGSDDLEESALDEAMKSKK